MTTVRGMGTIAAKYWWVLLVRGIILILLGIAMFAWPKATLLGVRRALRRIPLRRRRDVDLPGLLRTQGRPAFRLAVRPGRAGHRLRIAVLAWPDTIGKVLMISSSDLGHPGRHRRHRGRLPDEAGAGLRLGLVPGLGHAGAVFGIALIANPAAGILSILWLVAHLGDHGRHRVHLRQLLRPQGRQRDRQLAAGLSASHRGRAGGANRTGAGRSGPAGRVGSQRASVGSGPQWQGPQRMGPVRG